MQKQTPGFICHTTHTPPTWLTQGLRDPQGRGCGREWDLSMRCAWRRVLLLLLLRARDQADASGQASAADDDSSHHLQQEVTSSPQLVQGCSCSARPGCSLHRHPGVTETGLARVCSGPQGCCSQGAAVAWCGLRVLC